MSGSVFATLRSTDSETVVRSVLVSFWLVGVIEIAVLYSVTDVPLSAGPVLVLNGAVLVSSVAIGFGRYRNRLPTR